MARPKVIKVFGGEVILKNLPKDKQDAIAKMVQTFEIESPPAEVESVVEAEVPAPVAKVAVEVNDLMKDLALGLMKDSSGTYKLVDVLYNVETKQAVVDSVREVGRHKEVAVSEFRVKAARKLMV